MDGPVNRKLMIAFDLMCPGVGHIVVGWRWGGLAGLTVFLAAVTVLCCHTVVPFWNLLQSLLNGAEELPERPFRMIPIFSSLGVSLLDWLILLFDGIFRKGRRPRPESDSN